MGSCFSPTRMASFDFNSYFSKSFSPSLTCISSRAIKQSCLDFRNDQYHISISWASFDEYKGRWILRTVSHGQKYGWWDHRVCFGLKNSVWGSLSNGLSTVSGSKWRMLCALNLECAQTKPSSRDRVWDEVICPFTGIIWCRAAFTESGSLIGGGFKFKKKNQWKTTILPPPFQALPHQISHKLSPHLHILTPSPDGSVMSMWSQESFFLGIKFISLAKSNPLNPITLSEYKIFVLECFGHLISPSSPSCPAF